VTFARQSAQLPAIKEVRPEYYEINAQVLQDVLHRLERACAAFFRRVQAGERPGYPRYQGRDRYNSFTYPQVGAPGGHGGHGGAVVDGGMLSLSKIGRIRLRLHRPLHGAPKTVTIRREADGWYACISCAEVPSEPLPPTGQETGIDVGLKVFLITADGEVVANPRHYRKAERRLARAQRRVSRRTKGSRRRRKAVQLLKRHHQTVQRQRRDFHHKAALALLQQFDTISLENLQVRNLVRNHHLAKSISDAAWRQFCTLLEAKAACAGRPVLAIPPAYTSQDCSGVLPDGSRCTQRVAKSFSVRIHVSMSVRPVGWCSTAMKTRPRTFCGWDKSRVGPGRPVRRHRWPLGRASPEQPPASAVGSKSHAPKGRPANVPLVVRWLEHAPKQVRLEESVRIILPLESQQCFDGRVAHALPIELRSEQRIFRQVEASACRDHERHKLAEHVAQARGHLRHQAIVRFEREAVDLIAQQKRIRAMLMDNSPERHTATFLRAPHDFREDALRMRSWDEDLQRQHPVRERRLVEREGFEGKKRG
jgi:putative transposase